MLRLMHLVCGPVLPVGLVVIGIGIAGIGLAAAQSSPETRDACTPDALVKGPAFVLASSKKAHGAKGSLLVWLVQTRVEDEPELFPVPTFPKPGSRGPTPP